MLTTNTSNTVSGPDGKPLTLKNLPKPDTRRWISRRKAEVVAAVLGGIITKNDACQRYSLSNEEFSSWEQLYQQHGLKGLRTTRIQTYR